MKSLGVCFHQLFWIKARIVHVWQQYNQCRIYLEMTYAGHFKVGLAKTFVIILYFKYCTRVSNSNFKVAWAYVMMIMMNKKKETKN